MLISALTNRVISLMDGRVTSHVGACVERTVLRWRPCQRVKAVVLEAATAIARLLQWQQNWEWVKCSVWGVSAYRFLVDSSNGQLSKQIGPPDLMIVVCVNRHADVGMSSQRPS
jgi:hypothetical protein